MGKRARGCPNQRPRRAALGVLMGRVRLSDLLGNGASQGVCF